MCVYGLEQRCGARLCTFKLSWDGRRSGGEGVTRRNRRIILYLWIEFIFDRFYKVFQWYFLEIGFEIEVITWAKITLVDWGIYYIVDARIDRISRFLSIF